MGILTCLVLARANLLNRWSSHHDVGSAATDRGCDRVFSMDLVTVRQWPRSLSALVCGAVMVAISSGCVAAVKPASPTTNTLVHSHGTEPSYCGHRYSRADQVVDARSTTKVHLAAHGTTVVLLSRDCRNGVRATIPPSSDSDELVFYPSASAAVMVKVQTITSSLPILLTTATGARREITLDP
jgi:hypothetical protein